MQPDLATPLIRPHNQIWSRPEFGRSATRFGAATATDADGGGVYVFFLLKKIDLDHPCNWIAQIKLWGQLDLTNLRPNFARPLPPVSIKEGFKYFFLLKIIYLGCPRN